ncbi:LacI family DNA-binding transcriptional regulator [Streptomyces hydrogenans]|uniref:LacI family transcriptional regulator n=1 Tax=Streptomyces hydrogenans TaxID=1873719 RepID=A0ABQ3PM99_9ACTN|nr:LacI family DNA-binding transcriptional regulator [Streptomyces hydrogenans]GHF96763.1 LacI family transcriptional regulator [Streptomyces hydrogenans]GHI26134.1 LacI family transcriptional regulator [Streptomyces hydrogenans]
MSQSIEQPADGTTGRTPVRAVPTSADVARLAGVSRATVSYVLNNTSAVRISEPTRERVREAARELGYVPHAAARTLRAGHSRLVLLPTAHVPVGPLYSGFFNDLQWALRRLDYTVVQYGSVGLAAEDAARAWAELRPAAVVSMGEVEVTPGAVEILRRSGVKAVITVGTRAAEGTHSLVLDQPRVGEVAAEHLIATGRRRIGVVVPEEPGLGMFSGPRLDGARRAAEAAGATVVPLPLAYTEESAVALAARWPELGLDAVFGYNDEYAMLLMRALQDAGVDVPGDTAVIGADDLLLGRLLRPRLSTVHIDLIEGGELAALVDDAVNGTADATGRRPLLDSRVIVRESS